MKNTDRRTFLGQAAGAAVGIAAFSAPHTTGAASPNDRICIGLIGPGGMGTSLLKSFASQPDVVVGWVCDPDSNRMAAASKIVGQAGGKAPKMDKDMRRVLEDKSVDAVVIATPDHWHGPATLLACEAGKHVYVEKPCCHNIREGRLMVEAARRHRCIVQTGTQSRSTEHVIRAMELLREGAIGDVLVAKAWNSQLRKNVGRVKPSEPPPHLDFDLWVGPAPMVPYQSNMLHASWRWWRAFGTGDIGNDGVHDIDIARWGLGVGTHPRRIAALGGKYFFDDDQQFPDTQSIVYEYDMGEKGKRQLIYEQRIWSPYVQEGHENGNAFYGTKGMLILGKGSGWQLFGPRNQPGQTMSGRFDNAAHHRNFLDCIKASSRPNADIEIGHLSASLAHLGNIATRVGRVLHFDPDTEEIRDDPEANRLVRRDYRPGHWAAPKAL